MPDYWWRPRLQGCPLFPTTAPSVLAEINTELKLVAAGQKIRRGSYKSFLSFTPEEKVRVASVNGVQSWLAPRSESNPRGHAQSYVYTCMCTATQRHSFVQAAVMKSKSWKLILKAGFDFSRNLAPPKITRHTVKDIVIHYKSKKKLSTDRFLTYTHSWSLADSLTNTRTFTNILKYTSTISSKKTAKCHSSFLFFLGHILTLPWIHTLVSI